VRRSSFDETCHATRNLLDIPMPRTEPHFLPWVGPSFGTGPLGERRLLLLGEAHYSDDPADDIPGLTKDVVSRVENNKQKLPFFTKAAQVVGRASGLAATEDSRDVWASVAFYNFVPQMAASAARVRPTPEMWKAGGAPFATVLDDVRPARVLVLGADVWNHLSGQFLAGWTSQPITVGQPIFQWSGPDGRGIITTWIDHPSSFGFSVEHWVGRAAGLLGSEAKG
jgi:hypothetical protein